jgi:hypothetical protein
VSLLRYDAELNILVVTKGHPFARDPFFAMFDAEPGIAWSNVDQPAAQVFFHPERAKPYDAFVLYDMPGIEFGPKGPRFHDPPEDYVNGFLDLLDRGHGFVFLHHAIAGWPTWPEYARIVGARFLYAPGEVAGAAYPASGYRHDVAHRISVVDADHPVTRELGTGFEFVDELYLCPVLEDACTPLLTSDHDFVDREFYSAELAVRGEMFSRAGWSHPNGSNWIAWTQRYRSSPIVTIACGDSPNAYESPQLRRLIANAIRYVAAEARSDS